MDKHRIKVLHGNVTRKLNEAYEVCYATEGKAPATAADIYHLLSTMQELIEIVAEEAK